MDSWEIVVEGEWVISRQVGGGVSLFDGINWIPCAAVDVVGSMEGHHKLLVLGFTNFDYEHPHYRHFKQNTLTSCTVNRKLKNRFVVGDTSRYGDELVYDIGVCPFTKSKWTKLFLGYPITLIGLVYLFGCERSFLIKKNNSNDTKIYKYESRQSIIASIHFYSDYMLRHEIN